MVKTSFIEKTYVVGTHWNCLIEAIPICTYSICSMRQFHCVPTRYVTENKDNSLDIYTCQVSCPSSFYSYNDGVPRPRRTRHIKRTRHTKVYAPTNASIKES